MIEVSGPTDSDANLALIDKTDYKSYVKTQSAESDTMLDMIIPSLCREFFDETGRKFMQNVSAHTWLLDGTQTRILKLPQWPIVTVTSVETGYLASGDVTNFTVEKTLTTDDYMVRNSRGTLIRWNGKWWGGTETIRVVWTAGYTTTPAPLVRAMCEWTGIVLKRATGANWDLRAQTKGSESKVLDPSDRPASIVSQMRKYATEGLGIG